MPTIEKSIDVERTLRAVYTQWTRFEDYPSFMSELVAVVWLAAGCLQWSIEIGGNRYKVDVEVTEQIPNRRVSWSSRGGGKTAGSVNLYSVPDNGTRVMLQLTYPSEAVPQRADPIETVRDLVRRDLERFKQRMEGQTKSGA